MKELSILNFSHFFSFSFSLTWDHMGVNVSNDISSESTYQIYPTQFMYTPAESLYQTCQHKPKMSHQTCQHKPTMSQQTCQHKPTMSHQTCQHKPTMSQYRPQIISYQLPKHASKQSECRRKVRFTSETSNRPFLRKIHKLFSLIRHNV